MGERRVKNDSRLFLLKIILSGVVLENKILGIWSKAWIHVCKSISLGDYKEAEILKERLKKNNWDLFITDIFTDLLKVLYFVCQ